MVLKFAQVGVGNHAISFYLEVRIMLVHRTDPMTVLFCFLLCTYRTDGKSTVAPSLALVRQARVTDDSSSKGSTAALSPESVTSSRGQEKHRRRGSGDLGGSGGHRPNAISSDSSSSVVLGDNLPQPPANGSGGDHVVPKMAPGDAAKIPVRTTVAARARPPTHATNPAS